MLDIHQSTRKRKANAQAGTVRGFGPVPTGKRGEYSFYLERFKSNTGVTHTNHRLPCFKAGSHRDLSLGWCELDGIAQQIFHDLPQARPIPNYA